MKEEKRIVSYDEDFLYLSDGTKTPAPDGFKYDPDIIKKILEVDE